MTCKTCKFNSGGTCRRYPPTPPTRSLNDVLTLLRKIAGVREPENYGAAPGSSISPHLGGSVFPSVASGDWCGEYAGG